MVFGEKGPECKICLTSQCTRSQLRCAIICGVATLLYTTKIAPLRWPGDWGVRRRYAPTNGARVESNVGFSALRCRRTLVGADTAHYVRGLRPLGVSRPASRPFNPRAGAAQLAPR